jgi:hypothetical protein
MSLPRSHSHNKPTNPRNKPQLKSTRKRNSRSERLRQYAVTGADHPHGPGRLSAGAWRTVRRFTMDHSKKPPKPPVAHHEIRTVCTLPVDRPCRMDCPRSTCGPFAKLLATENHRLDVVNERQTRTLEELLGACELSAWCADIISRLTS